MMLIELAGAISQQNTIPLEIKFYFAISRAPINFRNWWQNFATFDGR